MKSFRQYLNSFLTENSQIENAKKEALDKLNNLIKYLPTKDQNSVLDVILLVNKKDPEMIVKATEIFNSIEPPAVLYRAMRQSKNIPRITLVDPEEYEPPQLSVEQQNDIRNLVNDLKYIGQKYPDSYFAPAPQGATLANIILRPLVDAIGVPRGGRSGGFERTRMDESGNVIPLYQRFIPESFDIRWSRVEKEKQDADYLTAVAAGDMETAQQMVDEAINRSSRTVYYRAGSASEKKIKPWAAFAKDLETAVAYIDNPGFGGPVVRRVATSAIVFDATGESGMRRLADAIGMDRQSWRGAGWDYPWEESKQVRDAIQSAGIEAISYTDDFPAGATAVVFTKDPGDAVDAAPVTYDENGNVIPLSKRFNLNSKSINESNIILS